MHMGKSMGKSSIVSLADVSFAAGFEDYQRFFLEETGL